jgi:hypothetical protein
MADTKWTRVTWDDYVKNLFQVLACEVFRVEVEDSVFEDSVCTIYWFSLSALGLDEKVAVFAEYHKAEGLAPDSRYYIYEKGLSDLAYFAALDSVLGDVEAVAVS